MRRETGAIARRERPGVTFDDLATLSSRVRECLEIARTAAPTEAAILILGETGTGKTMLAMAIHEASRRRDGPFVNCSAVSEHLLESELFGHEKGAFTSADRDHRGKFELAHGGTLFLDEIGNLSPSAQAKILRAVEQKEFEKLGGEETIRADTRIVAATNSALEALIETGEFRRDLFYRLSEILVDLPPLRERKEDIPLLVERFIVRFNQELGRQVKGVSDVTLNFLSRYHWPGNVRELMNVVRRGVMNAEREQIWLEDLNLRFQPAESPRDEAGDQDLTLDGVEKRHIKQVLELTRGNKRKACELLGISRPTLDRKIHKYKLEAGKA